MEGGARVTHISTDKKMKQGTSSQQHTSRQSLVHPSRIRCQFVTGLETSSYPRQAATTDPHPTKQ